MVQVQALALAHELLLLWEWPKTKTKPGQHPEHALVSSRHSRALVLVLQFMTGTL